MRNLIESDSDVPLLKGKTVGIVFNLKKGIKKETVDSEAEYDNIETVYAIEGALRTTGAKVILLEADEELPMKLKKTRPDFVFNIAEGTGGSGREAQVPAILNMYGICHTGSDETALCIALDKALTKRLLSTYHIKTPRYVVLGAGKRKDLRGLKFPVIVKPNAEGSSKGISDCCIVENKEELLKLVNENISMYHQDMLVEEYIEGREFTVGILGNGKDTRVFTPMEIAYKQKTQGDYHVYSYQVKQDYRRYIDYYCPSDIATSIQEKMQSDAQRIYEALGCKDFARADFRVAEDGTVYFIEINPLPGLAPDYSDYPMLADFCGVGYDEIVKSVLYAAVKRCRKDGALSW